MAFVFLKVLVIISVSFLVNAMPVSKELASFCEIVNSFLNESSTSNLLKVGVTDQNTKKNEDLQFAALRSCAEISNSSRKNETAKEQILLCQEIALLGMKKCKSNPKLLVKDLNAPEKEPCSFYQQALKQLPDSEFANLTSTFDKNVTTFPSVVLMRIKLPIDPYGDHMVCNDLCKSAAMDPVCRLAVSLYLTPDDNTNGGVPVKENKNTEPKAEQDGSKTPVNKVVGQELDPAAKDPKPLVNDNPRNTPVPKDTSPPPSQPVQTSEGVSESSPIKETGKDVVDSVQNALKQPGGKAADASAQVNDHPQIPENDNNGESNAPVKPALSADTQVTQTENTALKQQQIPSSEKKDGDLQPVGKVLNPIDNNKKDPQASPESSPDQNKDPSSDQLKNDVEGKIKDGEKPDNTGQKVDKNEPVTSDLDPDVNKAVPPGTDELDGDTAPPRSDGAVQQTAEESKKVNANDQKDKNPPVVNDNADEEKAANSDDTLPQPDSNKDTLMTEDGDNVEDSFMDGAPGLEGEKNEEENVEKNLPPPEVNDISSGQSQQSGPSNSVSLEPEDGHFFAYFLTVIIIIILVYLVIHNKQKILGLIVEGRGSQRRRSHSYRKLDADSSKGSQMIF